MRRLSDSVLETLRIVDDNPAYRHVFLSLLEYCREERAEEDAVAYGESAKTAKSQIQGAYNLIEALVMSGALERTVFINGEAYEGTFEDTRTDEAIPEDAEIAITVKTTETGLAAIERKAQEYSLESIVSACPHRADAFLLVLELCSSAAGASTRELQSALKESGMLETEERGIDMLHASYFTGSLESIGALTWNGKRWVASEKGLGILQSCAREEDE